MKLLSALHFLAIFSALLLHAAVHSALASPIPAGDSANRSLTQSILFARANHKSSKKPSAGPSGGKKVSTGPPGPGKNITPRPLNDGEAFRPGGPLAYAAKLKGSWKKANKQERAFLDPESKPGNGKMFNQALQGFGRQNGRTLYSQDADGNESNKKGKSKSTTTGSRIDR